MEKRTIPLTLLVLALSLMLVFSENVKHAYAIAVISDTYKTGVTTAGIGYNSSLDYLIAYQSNILEIQVIDGADLTSIANITTPRQFSGCIDNQCIINIGTTAYSLSVDTGTTPDSHYLNKINLNTFAITTVLNQTAGMNGCNFNTPVRAGSSVYSYMSGAACTARGWYNINLGATTGAYLQRISDGTTTGNISVQDICYSSEASRIIFARQGSNLLYFTTVQESQTTLDLGGQAEHIYCVDNDNIALIASDTGGWVKTVNTSTATLIATTNIAGAKDIIIHADDVYVSDSNADVTICEYSATATMVCSATVTIATDALMINANSTRFNALNNPSSNDGIAYSVYGLESSGGSEEPSGGNQIDGVCGVGTALECIGDRTTINQITGAQNITTIIGNLGTQLGILNTTANTDPETNGSGLILMLSTGALFSSVTISAIAVANNKFGANIQYTEIPKEYWLFLVIGVVALAFYLNWVPDIVFYGMVVGLAGLFSFGLYTKYKGNG